MNIKGVRQCCVALPHPFLLYTDMIIQNIVDGFRVGGTVINNLMYTDGTVIIAESEEQ